MVEFKSIISFDLETTSMPHLDHNTTKITELAFIGCEVGHLNPDNLPRVLHKLVLPFNPQKMIAPKSTQVSGLSNELLENVGAFTKEDVNVLKHFISRLPPPVCIVAHNGYKFDFPILQRAIKHVNMELQNNVYCFDSLKAFHSLLPTVKRENVNWMAVNEKTPSRIKPYNIEHRRNVSKALFVDNNELTPNGVSHYSGESSQMVPNSPQSHKLKDIYYHYFKEYLENAHSAEVDAKALLCCIMKCDGFLNWMNEHSVIFNSIEPLQ